MPDTTPLFHARNLCCRFGSPRNGITAVTNVSFDINAGEVVSIAGESGSGKTTLARLLLGLETPTAGTLLFEGRPLRGGHAHWRRVQAVFQDPFCAFNQFFTVRSQLRDAFGILADPPPRRQRDTLIDNALLGVNLEPERVADKYPFELSGGQMQRLLLARVFLIRPSVLLADEPTSMIDACSRTGILESLLALKQQLGMTIIFITHDIGLAACVSDRIFIMHRGAVVEEGPPTRILATPACAYTRRLLNDIPHLNRPWLTRQTPLTTDSRREVSS